MAPMARTNPTQPVHAKIADRYLKSARKLARIKAPAAGLHALEHAVAAAEHAQYSGDVFLLDEAVAVASQLQSRVLADMGSGREMLAVPVAWANPRLKVPDRDDEEAIQELVRKAQAGNQEAFGALYSLYYDRVYQIALNRVRGGRKGVTLSDQQDAKDLAQTAFLKAMEKLQSFKGKSKFYTWLYRIVKNEASEWSRRLGVVSRARPKLSIDEELGPTPANMRAGTAGVSLGARRIARAVAAAMDKLKEKDREMILMADAQGMTVQQIAEATGAMREDVAPDTVRREVSDRLMAARRDLQKGIHKRLRPDISITPEKLKQMSPEEQVEQIETLKSEIELVADETKALEKVNKALQEAVKRRGKGPEGNPRRRARSALRRRLGLR